MTSVDALVASGATLTVDGSGLSGTKKLTWDGSAETNGRFNITGGADADTIIGGAGADSITSGSGADSISGGADNDTLVFGVNLTSSDTVDGGSGTGDILTFTDGNSASDDLNHVTNVETITL